MKIIKNGIPVALAAGLLALSASAASAGRVGSLTCNLGPTVGLIVTSHQNLSCSFIPSGPGRAERYAGAIDRFGIDLGFTRGGRMVWAVFAAGPPAPRALRGTYVGGSADVTLGVGLGANVLVGGSNRSIALQPLSIEGNTGLNIAAGVARLRLR